MIILFFQDFAALYLIIDPISSSLTSVIKFSACTENCKRNVPQLSVTSWDQFPFCFIILTEGSNGFKMIEFFFIKIPHKQQVKDTNSEFSIRKINN